MVAQSEPASQAILGATPAVAFGAALVASIVLSLSHPGQMLVAGFGVIALSVTAFIRWSRPPLERALAVLAMSSLTVPIALGAWVAVGRPIVRAGYSDPGTVFMVPFLVFVGAPVMAAILPPIASRAVRFLLRPDRPRGAAVIRAFAWMAILGAVALIAASISRSGHPLPESYFASLPVTGALPPLDTQRSASSTDPPQTLTMGALQVRRKVLDNHVRCGFSMANGVVPKRPELSLEGRDTFQSCNALAFRIDEAHGLIFVDESLPVHNTRRAAYDLARPDTSIDVYAARVGAIRIPNAFTAVAIVGALVGLLALYLPRRPLLPLDAALCHDAIASGDGTLRLEGEATPLSIPPGMTLSPGRVVVVSAPHAESFRTPASLRVVRVLPSTLAELRLAERLMPHALAWVIVMVSCAPLAVAMGCLR